MAATTPSGIDRQVCERGIIATLHDVPGVDDDVRVLRTGIKLDAAPPHVTAPPPQLGEHTGVILAELGLGPRDIAQLSADGVL